ncbi:MAG: DUF2207 domain-containing protein [Synergistaceae bacterium]|jgi:uncharacterized membrane protein YgcG|nr:DUF2207 domain-containing protein [Synergistaceae bacterium]
MILRIALALLIALIHLSPGVSGASERILEMNVTAEVSRDATLSVRESLKVQTEGVDIKRGIIRSFPVEYTDLRGRANETDFDLISANIDGRPTKVSLERVGRNIEIRLGDPNRTLRKGIHIFDIEYRTLGWVAFRDSFDELYWNVTGNDWEFPIDRATFRLVLPDGASVRDSVAFTGRAGARGSGFRFGPDGVVETTDALMPGEGLTVSFAWDKGFVSGEAQAARERREKTAYANKVLFSVFLMLIIFVYYFGAWYLFGRDPTKGTVIPLYTPPNGVEPGFAKFLKDMRYSDDCLAADIIQLAVIGFIRFRERDGSIEIIPTDKAVGNNSTKNMRALGAQSPALHAIISSLIIGPGKHGVLVGDCNGDVFYKISNALKAEYEAKGRKYFTLNTRYSLIGLLLFVPFVPILAEWTGIFLSRIFSFIPLGFTGIVFMLRFFIGLKNIFARGYRVLRIVYSILLTILAGFAAFVLYMYDIVYCAAFFSAVIIAFLFARIMPARTFEGVKVNAELDGLAMYMGTAERHRLAMLNPPDETPRLFEALLPYAFALGCAKTWADGFADILENASYRPEWSASYGNETFTHFYPRLSNGLSRGISASVASHSDKPRSSSSSGSYGGGSGFGGGGHSGGGGGGGGGRGW